MTIQSPEDFDSLAPHERQFVYALRLLREDVGADRVSAHILRGGPEEREIANKVLARLSSFSDEPPYEGFYDALVFRVPLDPEARAYVRNRIISYIDAVFSIPLDAPMREA